MDWQAAAQALVTVATPVLAVLGVRGRSGRQRAAIRENVALLEEMKKDDLLREHTQALAWLQGKITIDVAKLTGQSLGARKLPINWGAQITSGSLLAVTVVWSYLWVRDGWVWYAIFPITMAALMLMAFVGGFTNREVPDDAELPVGAYPISSTSHEERVATAVHMIAAGVDPERFAEEGAGGVVLRFITLLRQGQYEEALRIADPVWVECRIQARLWNGTQIPGPDGIPLEEAQQLAESLFEKREPPEAWEEFVVQEAKQFVEEWAELDPEHLGAASRRRRMARDYDLVVLVPLSGQASDGYFVTSAAALPNALTFLVHRVEGRWLVANHAGWAPPSPGWPPVWWIVGDPAIESLPDTLT